jgi:hypothetical protein
MYYLLHNKLTFAYFGVHEVYLSRDVVDSAVSSLTWFNNVIVIMIR